MMITRAPRTPIASALFLLLLLTGCRPTPTPKLHLVSARVAAGHETMPYAVALPPGYSRQQHWRVLLFLHGFGERGEDGVSQTRGMGQFLQRYPKQFPCLVVMPQAPRSYVRWEGQANELALKALDDVVSRYDGDRHRLYLTGCSMGGGGCSRLAGAQPERF